MVSRATQKEAKEKAMADLKKVCLAILIDANREGKKARPEGSVIESVLQLHSSVSKKVRDHFAFEQKIENCGDRVVLTGKEVQLLGKFLEKHSYDTTKLFGKAKRATYYLDRQPTEEEEHWADSVFEAAELSPDYGDQHVSVTFHATVTLDFSKQRESSLEEYKDIVLSNVKKLQNFDHMVVNAAGVDWADRCGLPRDIHYVSTPVINLAYSTDSTIRGRYGWVFGDKKGWIKL